MFIGLTGGIGSGKNFIANIFQDKGCYILDADEVAVELMQPGQEAYRKIVDSFSKNILSKNDEIDRKKLREIILKENEQKKLLESLLHPLIRDYSIKWYKKIKSKDSFAIAIYHASLIIESGLTSDFDRIILIYASESTVLYRLKTRGHPPYEDAVKFMKKQLKYEQKIKFADYIIDNDSDHVIAEIEVNRVFEHIKLEAYAERIRRRNL